MKAVGRVSVDPLAPAGGAVTSAQDSEVVINTATSMDVMEVMLIETLKRSFPDVTVAEIDDIEQPDIIALSNAIAAVNGDAEEDFTPKSNTTK